MIGNLPEPQTELGDQGGNPGLDGAASLHRDRITAGIIRRDIIVIFDGIPAQTTDTEQAGPWRGWRIRPVKGNIAVAGRPNGGEEF